MSDLASPSVRAPFDGAASMQSPYVTDDSKPLWLFCFLKDSFPGKELIGRVELCVIFLM
jgi:hypothetical protein